jgi:hypothetical protein
MQLAIVVNDVFVVAGQAGTTFLIVRLVYRTHGPSRVMFDRGWGMGYQRGWREGHRSARPVVVPMRQRVS